MRLACIALLSIGYLCAESTREKTQVDTIIRQAAQIQTLQAKLDALAGKVLTTSVAGAKASTKAASADKRSALLVEDKNALIALTTQQAKERAADVVDARQVFAVLVQLGVDNNDRADRMEKKIDRAVYWILGGMSGLYGFHLAAMFVKNRFKGAS